MAHHLRAAARVARTTSSNCLTWRQMHPMRTSFRSFASHQIVDETDTMRGPMYDPGAPVRRFLEDNYTNGPRVDSTAWNTMLIVVVAGVMSYYYSDSRRNPETYAPMLPPAAKEMMELQQENAKNAGKPDPFGRFMGLYEAQQFWFENQVNPPKDAVAGNRERILAALRRHVDTKVVDDPRPAHIIQGQDKRRYDHLSALYRRTYQVSNIYKVKDLDPMDDFDHLSIGIAREEILALQKEKFRTQSYVYGLLRYAFPRLDYEMEPPRQ